MGFFSELIGDAVKNSALKAAAKIGKTDEQKKVIDYFFDEGNGGCLSKGMQDSEYDSMVKNRLTSINFEERAFSKLGIEKSQVSEVEPIVVEGYYTYSSDLSDDKLKNLFKIYTKVGADKKTRSSAYQKTCMYFSGDEVFMYQIIFFMDRDDINEFGKEFFYKDITSFTTKTTTEEHDILKKSGCLKKPTEEKLLIARTEFRLIVPGDEFAYSLYDNELRESSIQGIKAKFREAKNSK